MHFDDLRPFKAKVGTFEHLGGLKHGFAYTTLDDRGHMIGHIMWPYIKLHRKNKPDPVFVHLFSPTHTSQDYTKIMKIGFQVPCFSQKSVTAIAI